MFIADGITYIGVNDHEIDLFVGQYPVPNGMSYNSYAIIDEKIAIMDTVDVHFADEWLKNIASALQGKKPDFLIVQHMEPDHSGSVLKFVESYPETKIVASSMAFTMMKQFFGTDFSEKQIVVGADSSLELGKRTLSFVPAPMIHWPEVIVTYDAFDKILFSADAFGKFGALDIDDDWNDEARRYYIGIVGKYGVQVQSLLKKASALEIKKICSLHGPILEGDQMKEALSLYQIWSSYNYEMDGALIAYASIYGHTKVVAEKMYEEISALNKNVSLIDLARNDMSECVALAFKYNRIVFACSTYNGDIFPFMKSFIEHLTERNFQNRKVSFVENGSWAPNAANVMKRMLEKSKNLTIVEPVITVKGSYNDACAEDIKKVVSELFA